MARDGLTLLVRAGALVALPLLPFLIPPAAAAPPGDDRAGAVSSTLAVQTALQQGRDHLLKGNAQAAVYVLEAQIEKINGSKEYLAALRDAYRTYIKELRLAKKDGEADEYLKRLRVLDPGAVLDGSMARPAAVQASAAPAAPPAGKEPAEPAKATARGKIDDDPFRSENAVRREPPGVLEQAERLFAGKDYEGAGRLFEQAHQADQKLDGAARERWAYCKFYHVVQQLNQAGPGVAQADLEREVRLALVLAPRLEEYGKDLLHKVQDRRSVAAAEPVKGGEPAAAVTVRHLDRQADGWAVAETPNFRVLHNQSRDLAERAAQIAEATRSAMTRKWFGEDGEAWAPRCDLFLHATAQDYSRATGVPANSPGHSTIRSDAGRVVARRMDLRCDDPNLLGAVLPHETTHVVLAGRFGEFPVPRWADEGVAVLSEPRDKIDRHLHNLPQHRQDNQLFPVKQLLQLNDYPDPRYIGSFYAESVSVVEFLAHEKGPQTFTAFVRDGLRGGYEAALKKHYGMQDFNELEQRWRKYAFTEAVQSGYGGR